MVVLLHICWDKNVKTQDHDHDCELTTDRLLAWQNQLSLGSHCWGMVQMRIVQEAAIVQCLVLSHFQSEVTACNNKVRLKPGQQHGQQEKREPASKNRIIRLPHLSFFVCLFVFNLKVVTSCFNISNVALHSFKLFHLILIST